jgi:adenosine deaminase
MSAEIAALPKADIHIHAEWSPRLDRLLAEREGRPPYDWREWSRQLMQKPPGSPRLTDIASVFPATQEADALPENFVARVEHMLEEAAADGAIFVEVRFGKDFEERPNFMALFREAEARVQKRHPQFKAEPIPIFRLWVEPERLEQTVQKCLDAAQEGLAGADFLYEPYDSEADWTTAYRVAERLASAGLNLTVHAGEVSTANIEAALKVPGLTRIGHATYAAQDPRLFDLLAKSGVTVECSLTCNVVLGAAPSYEAHPIHQFVAAGIPVALCTDDPVQICTTIGQEYAIAHALGFSTAQLLDFTRNAISAAFTTPQRRSQLLHEIDNQKAC